MSAVYDYEAEPEDDPLLLAADKAIRVFVELASTRTAIILETFPFRKCHHIRLRKSILNSD
jgi:hypothetical protein